MNKDVLPPHPTFFVQDDKVQSHYECLRMLAIGLVTKSEGLWFYNLSEKHLHNFQNCFAKYGFAGLLGLKIEKFQIKPPKCQTHPIDEAKVLEKRYGNEKTRLARCPRCGYLFSVKMGTAVYRSHLPLEEYAQIVKALAEGTGIRATARIFDIDKDTVLRVLRNTAAHCRKLSRHFLTNLHIEECQIDELWSFVRKKEKNLNPMDVEYICCGDQWVWIGFDSIHKIVLAYVVGKHTLENAVLLIRKIKAVCDKSLPFFTSDELPHYPDALLQVYGRMVKQQRTGKRGRHPLPKLVPPASLKYAQVRKVREKGRVVKIQVKVICGNGKEIKTLLQKSPVSQSINTSFVERNNGTLRHIDKRLARKTYCFSKELDYHRDQLDLSLAYYHFVKTHKSLRVEENQNGKRWLQRTPFYAAGLTDHVWTMEELLIHKIS